MNKSINILDPDYNAWVKELALRYRHHQIKAAIRVHTEMLKFYWSLGRDIVEPHTEKRWDLPQIEEKLTETSRILSNCGK